MCKSFFCIACLVCTASATPISAAFGVFINQKPLYQDFVDLTVEADGAPPHHPVLGVEAFVSITDDYTLTITGGTGHGSFVPCMAWGPTLNGSVATGSASFGPVNTPNFYTVGRTCLQPAPGQHGEGFLPVASIPFVFGVQQEFTISLRARAAEGEGRAILYGFEFRDAAGNPESAHFILAEVPEPATWLLVGTILVCCLISGARDNGR